MLLGAESPLLQPKVCPQRLIRLLFLLSPLPRFPVHSCASGPIWTLVLCGAFLGGGPAQHSAEPRLLLPLHVGVSRPLLLCSALLCHSAFLMLSPATSGWGLPRCVAPTSRSPRWAQCFHSCVLKCLVIWGHSVLGSAVRSHGPQLCSQLPPLMERSVP